MIRLCTLLLLLAVSLLANHPARGTVPADSIRSRNISDYIERLDTLMLFKVGLTNDYESFQQEGESFYYDIRPNIPMATRFSFNYRFLSVAVKFKSPVLTETDDETLKGNTDHFGFAFKFSFRNWIQDFHFSNVKGYYVHNTGELISGWNEGTDPYIQLPDLDVLRIGGSTTYKFNPRFSFKALSTQTEVQLKSCGSFATTLMYDLYYLKNKTTASSEPITQESSNLDFILSAGYYYTYVISKKMYAAAGLSIGGGVIYSELTTTYDVASLAPVTGSYTNPLFNAKLHAGAGYNAKRFVAGAEIFYSDAEHKESNTNVSTDYSSYFFQVFFGMRITAPKFVRKSFDTAGEIVPLLK